MWQSQGDYTNTAPSNRECWRKGGRRRERDRGERERMLVERERGRETNREENLYMYYTVDRRERKGIMILGGKE